MVAGALPDADQYSSVSAAAFWWEAGRENTRFCKLHLSLFSSRCMSTLGRALAGAACFALHFLSIQNVTS